MTTETASPNPLIETIVVPRSTDLGDGFVVKRALPSAQKRMVGPFVFFDQMGPTVLRAGTGLDVRPHPHIGLSTVTYLFDGEIMHRDSLGTVLPIRPHELNWMTAGRGIVHSERTPDGLRAQDKGVFGIQAWVALPARHEETDPAFAHFGADELPVISDTGFSARLIAGSALGARAPVEVLSDMFYLDVTLQPGGRLPVATEHVERAAYVVSGQVQVGSDATLHAPDRLVVFAPGQEVVLQAVGGPARVMLCGGEPMDGPRFLWWNFVSSSRERIEQAKADWLQQRFPAVPDETEFIPLPPPASRPAA